MAKVTCENKNNNGARRFDVGQSDHPDSHCALNSVDYHRRPVWESLSRNISLFLSMSRMFFLFRYPRFMRTRQVFGMELK